MKYESPISNGSNVMTYIKLSDTSMLVKDYKVKYVGINGKASS